MRIFVGKRTIATAGLILAVVVAKASVVIDPASEIGVADTSKVYDIDEVVVISQPKESYRLRQQPMSATMFSAGEITAIGARDLREMAAFVPSFAMPEYGSRITSSMYIRGIGSRVNNPAVGIYVDGIPVMSKSAFNMHAYGLERVDVLRGPQGTLYGQNTEGGMVRMYTLNPMRYQGTDIRLGVGSRLYRNAEVAHYAKMSEQLALSVAAFYDGQNGFFRNTYNGERADKMNEAGGRLRLVWQPTSRFSLDWVNDYQYVRQNGFPYGVYDEKEQTTKEPSTNYQGNYRRNAFISGLNMKYAFDGIDLTSNTSYQFLKDYMLMDQDYLPDDYMHLIQRQLQNSITQELAVRSTADTKWHWTFGAFGSYQWLKTVAPVFFDEGITAPIANGIRGAMYGAMLNSMAGRMIEQFIQRGMPADQAQAAAQQAAAAAIEKAGGVTMNVTMDVPGVFRTPQFNLGIFHQTDFEITDRLIATVGLRYDFSKVKIDYDTKALMAMTANVMGTEATYTLSSILNHENDNSYNQLLPKLGLTYKFGSGNIYATVSKGYRAGGFNMQMFSDILQTELNANSQKAMRGDYDVPHDEDAYERMAKTIAYKPEVSWNYEAGTHLNLFGNRMMLDFSAFYMQVRNQQLSVMAGDYGFGRMMVNAGKSFSCGIEVAASGRAFDNRLAWGVTYGLTHAEFKEYTDSVVGVYGAGGPVSSKMVVDYKGKRVPYVPMHTFSAHADYRIPFASETFKAIVLGANVRGQGSTYWNETNTLKQKVYAVIGAHADAEIGPVVFSVWGRNLNDARYNTFMVSSAATGQEYHFAQRGNPFQMGVDVRMHF